MRCFIPFLQHSTHIYTASIELGTLFLIKKYLESQSVNDDDASAATSDAEFMNKQRDERR